MSAISLKKATDTPVFWKQIYWLLALETAVTIGWFAYEQFQPTLLAKFSFQPFAALLLIVQGLLGSLLHPFSGSLADSFFHKRLSKFPVIISGIVFAAIVFMLVSIAVLMKADNEWRWAVPFLVILWLAAMSTFHSPAISMVESLAPPQKIPQISAFLVMAFGLVYAIGPLLIWLLNLMGLTATFLLGGFLLAVTGFSLQYVARHDKSYHAHLEHYESDEQTVIKPVWLSLTGFFIGLCKGSVIFALPVWLQSGSHTDKNTLEAIIMACSALFALPMSYFISKIGEKKTLLIGCGTALICTVMVLMFKNNFSAYFFMAFAGFTYSLLAVSALPFVLRRVAQTESGSAIGLFYGGVSAGLAGVALLIL